jgi:TPR repeat protein
VQWWRKAAEQGQIDAQYKLGHAYHEGRGVAQDSEQAVHWWRKAATRGDVDSEYWLGHAYHEGHGVSRDPKLAAEWWGRAARRAHVGAFERLEEAANRGETEAQVELGLGFRPLCCDQRPCCYGFCVDPEQATHWLQKAAEQGNTHYVQYKLAAAYHNGWGVPKDPKKAAHWWGKAGARDELKHLAEQGNHHAQYELGVVFAEGRGIVQDFDEAEYWWRKAKAQGHRKAKIRLSELRRTF